MKRGSYDKNNSLPASQNAVGGLSRFPKIAGGLQKMEKVQHMGTNTQTTRFPKIQMTSARVPVIRPNKLVVANQGLAEIPVKDPDVKPYVRYGESFSSLLSSRFPPLTQRHHGETAAHSGQAPVQRSHRITDNPLQPHPLAKPCDDQFGNRLLKRPRIGKGRHNYF